MFDFLKKIFGSQKTTTITTSKEEILPISVDSLAKTHISLISKSKLISKVRESEDSLGINFRNSYKIAGIDLFGFVEYYIENFSGVEEGYPDINTTKKILPLIQVNEFIQSKDSMPLNFKIKNNRVFICSNDERIIIPCLPPIYDKYENTFQIEPLLIKYEELKIVKGQRSHKENGIRFNDITYSSYLLDFLKSKNMINSIEIDEFALSLGRTLYKYFYQHVITEIISLRDYSDDHRVTIHFKYHLISYHSYLLLVYFGFRVYDVRLFVDLLLNSLQGRSHATFHFRLVKSSRDYLSVEKVREELFNRFKEFNSINDFFKISELANEIQKALGLRFQSEFEILRLSDIHFYHIKEKYPSFNIVFISDSDRKNSKKYKLHQYLKEYKEELKDRSRELENDIRRNLGFTSVGMYVKESFLYHKFNDELKDFKVIPQGSPDWLGMQRIDIYLPELNLGIEYQGEQHFYPIEIFGGESSFKRNQERDELKLKLCIANGCKLFYINYFDEIEEKAEEIIEKIKAIKKVDF